jgi:hypothetical protein
MSTALKCIGFYRGFALFNDGGHLFAVEREAARQTRPASDDDIILGGPASTGALDFIVLIIDSRDPAAPIEGDWMRLDWQ